MEVERQQLEGEEEEELGELCAEILENWNSPIYSDLTHSFLHRNPFSTHDHQQLNTITYDIQRVKQKLDSHSIVSNAPGVSFHATQLNQAISRTNVRPNYEDDYAENLEILEQKEDKIFNENRSKHQEAENNAGGMDQPLIPLLVVDTFFNKILGRGVDGIDIADLNMVEEARASDGDNLRTILNDKDAYGKEMDKLNSGQIISSGSKCNLPVEERIPNKRMPAKSTAEIRNCCEAGFVCKLSFRLPSNKTIFDINLDNFREKSWRGPGVDISDFFNYGLDEKQWKDYCKLMMAKARAGGSGQSKPTADESRQSRKEGATCEVKPNMRINECLPLMDPKDLSFYDSDVIIEVLIFLLLSRLDFFCVVMWC
ncbi:hypothetical protein CDL12_03254 [Handroanthus impetiginosus]|uniref:Pre-mRNA polyadenylation factor Fip1 domain-containing protein n=1 Tax=Handroanthus impetiginosus TaxID=429701 RepID=A0A2G9I2L8_9LAMI|nr:hypothetical protein CDL12_03254 [Handroanthus impetiginosus]